MLGYEVIDTYIISTRKYSRDKIAFLFAYGAKAFTAVLLASRKWNSLQYGNTNLRYL